MKGHRIKTVRLKKKNSEDPVSLCWLPVVAVSVKWDEGEHKHTHAPRTKGWDWREGKGDGRARNEASKYSQPKSERLATEGI